MSKALTPFEALEKAVLIAGGQSATARICGKSQTAVWKWLQSGKRLPAEHVLDIEEATGVSRHDLRPDIYPLSNASEYCGHNEDCGPVLSRTRHAVAGNPPPAFPRKDVA